MADRTRLKRRVIKWLKALMIVGGAVLWMFIATSASKNQYAIPCQERFGINIKGNDHLRFITEQQVYMLISESYGRPIQGESLGEVQLDAIERIVMTIPHVKDASAHVDMHGRLSLDIVQKQPLARVLHNDGVSYYLDQSGSILPLSDNFTARVPVISGTLTSLREGQSVSDNAIWKVLYSFMQTIGRDKFMSALLEQIHREQNGELLLISKLGDAKIRFGKPEDVDGKLAKLRTFFERGITSINFNQFESIDLRFAGQVVCKKRNA